jgi:hypothetical protein
LGGEEHFGDRDFLGFLVGCEDFCNIDEMEL